MTNLRKKEFIEMLDNFELNYNDKGKFIQCELQNLGKVTYYPKANKLQINKTNKWQEDGLYFVKDELFKSEKYELNVEEEICKNHEKVNQIYYLMILAKMSLSEINTLTDFEREYLSVLFVQRHREEMASLKPKN